VSNGDIDPVINLHGTEAAVRALGYPAKEGEPRRPWFFNQTAADSGTVLRKPVTWGEALVATDAGAQVGGFVEAFDVGGRDEDDEGAPPVVDLKFLTVRNSGHMVPAYTPQRAAHVLEAALLGGRPLSPPLPKGWDSESDAAFYARDGGAPGTFAKWAREAMSEKYAGSGRSLGARQE
jgi:hypothetical protein